MNTTVDYEKVRELYEQGLNDREITERAGCGHRTVWKWRDRLNLPPNGQHIGKYDKQIRELYDRGLNDSEIIRQIHCSRNVVCRWREKRNLPPNKSKESAAPKKKAAASATTVRYTEDKPAFDSAFKRINIILGTMDADDIPEVTETYYNLSKEIFEGTLNKYFADFKQRKTTIKAANNDGGSKNT